MSSSKHAILSALRGVRSPNAVLPNLNGGRWITYPDPTTQFADVLAAVGGKSLIAATTGDVLHELARLPAYTSAAKIYSLVSGIDSRNVDPYAITDPHQLEDIDFAVLPGQFAVAENAAVWVTDDGMPHRAIYFIAQHVALVIPAAQVVNNMHEAYEWLRFARPGYGCFISGPSKTADIEQSLVIGAHGARSLTVFLVGR